MFLFIHFLCCCFQKTKHVLIGWKFHVWYAHQMTVFANILTLRIYEIECCYLHSKYKRMKKKKKSVSPKSRFVISRLVKLCIWWWAHQWIWNRKFVNPCDEQFNHLSNFSCMFLNHNIFFQFIIWSWLWRWKEFNHPKKDVMWQKINVTYIWLAHQIVSWVFETTN